MTLIGKWLVSFFANQHGVGYLTLSQAKSSYLDSFTRELQSQAPRIFGPSPTMKVIRRIMGSEPVDDSSFFPATFFYQFVDTELWFALSFLPATETKTQIRYDIFSRSPVSETAAETISKTFANVSNSLIGQIEQQYRECCLAQRYVVCANIIWAA